MKSRSKTASDAIKPDKFACGNMRVPDASSQHVLPRSQAIYGQRRQVTPITWVLYIVLHRGSYASAGSRNVQCSFFKIRPRFAELVGVYVLVRGGANRFNYTFDKNFRSDSVPL
jgi:hypothetical protein